MADTMADSTAQTPSRPKKRCTVCNAKLGVLGGFECLCGHRFCPVHRSPEQHGCTYDYAERKRIDLPTIEHDRLPNRLD